MKKYVAVILVCALLLNACSTQMIKPEFKENTIPTKTCIDEEISEEEEANEGSTATLETETAELSENELDFTVQGLDDEKLIDYVENNVYEELVMQLDSEEYFVENVEAVYYPKEYIEALASNSQSNLYFGYTSAELDAQFQGTRYVFTLDEDGKTTVVPMETLSDDVYVQAMEDVIIGSGVILICVTVSLVTAPAAPAVSVIFAASATTGTTFALEAGTLGFASAAIAKGYETESVDQALKAGAEVGGEGFKWGAISGVIVGGGKEAIALKGAKLNGLTMNEAAKIQRETKWPLDAVKSLHSTAEYGIYKKAGVMPVKMVDGKWAFLRNINWKAIDSYGHTNVERVGLGLAPIDEMGMSYELHHIGMKADSPLAILTNAEHHAKLNYSILHWAGEGKNIADDIWQKQKKEFWKAVLDRAMEAGLV